MLKENLVSNERAIDYCKWYDIMLFYNTDCSVNSQQKDLLDAQGESDNNNTKAGI